MSSKNRRHGSGSQSSKKSDPPPQSKQSRTREPDSWIKGENKERADTQGDIDQSFVVPTLDADMGGGVPCPPPSHASSPRSRSSSPAPSSQHSEEPPSALGDAQLDKLFKMLSTKIESEAKSTKAEIAGLKKEFKGELKKVSRKQDSMDLRVTECFSRVTALETAFSNAENVAKEAQLEKAAEDAMRDQAAVASGPAPGAHAPASSLPGSSAGFSNFDKPGRPNAISCNLEGGVHFTRSVCIEFFKALLQTKGLDCEVRVEGLYEASKRFVVVFEGFGSVGTECVKTLLRARRDSDQKWIPYTVKTPSDADVRLYFDIEKSHKQIKLETITNSFSKLLVERFGEKYCYPRKDAGKILKEGAPMLQVSVTENASSIQWFRRFINKSSFHDKETIDKLFHESFGEELCS